MHGGRILGCLASLSLICEDLVICAEVVRGVARPIMLLRFPDRGSLRGISRRPEQCAVSEYALSYGSSVPDMERQRYARGSVWDSA